MKRDFNKALNACCLEQYEASGIQEYPMGSKILVFVENDDHDPMRIVQRCIEDSEDFETVKAEIETNLMGKGVQHAVAQVITNSRLKITPDDYLANKMDEAERLYNYLRSHQEQAVFLNTAQLGKIDLIADERTIDALIQVGRSSAQQENDKIAALNMTAGGGIQTAFIDSETRGGNIKLSMGSGGSKGAAQIGYISESQSLGTYQHPAEIHGCSTGALNGALLSAGVTPDEVIHLLKSGALKGISKTNPVKNRMIFSEKIRGLMNASVLMHLLLIKEIITKEDYELYRPQLIEAILTRAVTPDQSEQSFFKSLFHGGATALDATKDQSGPGELNLLTYHREEAPSIDDLFENLASCLGEGYAFPQGDSLAQLAEHLSCEVDIDFGELKALQLEYPEIFSRLCCISIDQDAHGYISSAETNPSEPVTYAVMNSASIPFAFQTGKGVEGEERFDGGFKYLNPTMMQSMHLEKSSHLDQTKDTGLTQVVPAESLRGSLVEKGSPPQSAPEFSPPASPSDETVANRSSNLMGDETEPTSGSTPKKSK